MAKKNGYDISFNNQYQCSECGCYFWSVNPFIPDIWKHDPYLCIECEKIEDEKRDEAFVRKVAAIFAGYGFKVKTHVPIEDHTELKDPLNFPN